MKKNLGVVQAVYPMPVLMVAAYDENGKVNVMNAAWGMICNSDRIALFIDEDHKTTQNLLGTKAFTVSLADKDHMDVADFFGIATGNKMADKFERTGYTAIKSEFVNAPIIDEFPVVMECELAEVVENDSFYCIVGKIVNTAAEEKVLSENGKVDPSKLQALIFDQFQHGYYVSGEQVGKAWNAGAGLMNGPHEKIMHANQLRTFKELGISRLLFVLGERRQPASFCVRGRHQPLAALGVRPHFCLKIV